MQVESKSAELPAGDRIPFSWGVVPSMRRMWST